MQPRRRLGVAAGVAAVRALAGVASTLLVAGAGLAFLLDTVFVRPDPQGALAVMATPLYQLLAAGIVVPVMAHFVRG